MDLSPEDCANLDELVQLLREAGHSHDCGDALSLALHEAVQRRTESYRVIECVDCGVALPIQTAGRPRSVALDARTSIGSNDSGSTTGNTGNARRSGSGCANTTENTGSARRSRRASVANTNGGESSESSADLRHLSPPPLSMGRRRRTVRLCWVSHFLPCLGLAQTVSAWRRILRRCRPSFRASIGTLLHNSPTISRQRRTGRNPREEPDALAGTSGSGAPGELAEGRGCKSPGTKE